jgi:hypothetical protein
MSREPQRSWTDEELGYVTDTMDRPRTEVAEHLGRSIAAVTHTRRHIRTGRVTTNQFWTAEEEKVLRDGQGRFTAQQLADQLPGRSVKKVQNHLSVLGIHLGYTQKRNPFFVANRPLIAKTCVHCGLLLPAKWFTFSPKSKKWASWCRKCQQSLMPDYKANRAPEKTARERSRQKAYARRAQNLTLLTADRTGQEYTEADHAVLSDPSMSLLGKALSLHRTYNATRSQLSLNGYLTFRTAGDPENDRWFINNPNLANVDAIRKTVESLVDSGVIERPEWMWDDESAAAK